MNLLNVLQETIFAYGGVRKGCFNNESKSRSFIDDILKYSVRKSSNFSVNPIVYLDAEVSVSELGKKIIPDNLIRRNNSS